MSEITFPVLDVQMIDVKKIEANDYNPNAVAPSELELLKLSIMEDGYTQPIVGYYDKEKDKYIVVDGYHRLRCALEYFHLKKVPMVIIDKSLDNRIASTIRHNRARGTHQIRSMSEIVLSLLDKGWDEVKIGKMLGMDREEVFRLKQVTGLKSAFANHEFSKSWEEFEKKFDEPSGAKTSNVSKTKPERTSKVLEPKIDPSKGLKKPSSGQLF